MAYTPTNWQTGDVITAEKLNKAEDGIANAQWKSTERTQLFSETVTTQSDGQMVMGFLEYSQLITAPTIKVVFDGTEYTCTAIENGGRYSYGGYAQSGPDFTEYPFVLLSSSEDGNTVFTETAGEYSISVFAKSIELDPTFEEKLNELNSVFVVNVTDDLIADKTNEEIYRAFTSNRQVVLQDNYGFVVPLTYCDQNDATFETIYSEIQRNTSGEITQWHLKSWFYEIKSDIVEHEEHKYI